MEGASDDVEGVVSESDDDVSAGGNHGSNGDPFPHAGVDGLESNPEMNEARSSKTGPVPLSSLWMSS
jgi:hypothetical protein